MDEKFSFLVDTVDQCLRAEATRQVAPDFYDIGISIAEEIL